MLNCIRLIRTLVLVVIMMSAIYANGQTSLDISSPATKKITLVPGDAPTPVVLRLNNTGSTIASTTVRVTSTAAGIYLYAGTGQASNVTVVEDPNHAYIDFTVTSFANGPVLLPVTMQVGHCHSFAEGVNTNVFTSGISVSNTSNGIINGNLEITVNRAATLTAAFAQNKVYVNGVLTSTGEEMSTKADVLNTVIRDYVFATPVSASGSYKGVVSIDGPDNASTPLQLTDINVYLYNPNAPSTYPGTALGYTNRSLNGWNITAAVEVPAGYQLIFRETILVTGCLSNNSGSITNNFSWGVGSWDACSGTTFTKKPTLTPADAAQISLIGGNFIPDYTCMSNSKGPTERNIIFKNNTSTVAYNYALQLFMYARTNYAVPSASFELYITKNNVTTGPYTIDWSQHEPFAGYALDDRLTYDQAAAIFNSPNVSDYLWNNVYNGNTTNTATVFQLKSAFTQRAAYERSATYTTDPLFYTMKMSYSDFMSRNAISAYYSADCLPDGAGTDLILTGTVSHYFLNGVSTPLNLAPGDEIEVKWDEYTCCQFNYNPVGIMGFWPYSRHTDACNNRSFYGHGQSAYIQTGTQLTPNIGNSNIEGEIDRCVNTSDGTVEKVSFSIAPYLTDENPDPNYNSKFVFKVYLDDGLDMDLSFQRPFELGLTANRGYANVTSGATPCDEFCTGTSCDVTDVMDAQWFTDNGMPGQNQYYRVNFVTATGTIIPLSAKVTRLATHGEAGKDYMLKYMINQTAGTTPSTAYYLYGIEIDLNTLGLSLPATSAKINDFFKGGKFEFDVRAYCPSTVGKKRAHIIMQYQKCATASLTTEVCTQTPMYSNAWTLSWINFAYQINCPGCKIPGSNISDSKFIRKNTGVLDTNNDGFPDDGNLPIPENDEVRRLATNGDVMEASFFINMSDGEASSSGVGFQAVELYTREIYLPYLIARITVSQSTTNYVAGTAKFSLDKITWYDITAANTWQIDNRAYFRMDAALVSSTVAVPSGAHTSFHYGQTVYFKGDFRITGMSSYNELVEVTYGAGYSTCGDCETFYEVSPELSNTGFASVLDHQSNLLLTCTDGGTFFKGIFYRNENNIQANDYAYDETEIDHRTTCKKTIQIGNWGEFGLTNNYGQANMFPGECRYFIPADVPVKTETTLPDGYEIDHVTIQNIAGQSGYRYRETIIIPAENITASLAENLPAGHTSFTLTTVNSHKVFGINLFYGIESQADEMNYGPPDNGFRHFQPAVKHTLPEKLIYKDEYWNTSVYVVLKPIANCSPAGQTIAYPDAHHLTNVPTGHFSTSTSPVWISEEGDPSRMAAITNSLTHDWNFVDNKYGTNTNFVDGQYVPYFTSSAASLSISTLSDLSLNIPDATRDIRFKLVNNSSAHSADYPFVVLEGSALDPAKGLTFAGVFNVNNQEIKNFAATPVLETFTGTDNLTHYRLIVPLNWAFATDGLTAGLPYIPTNGNYDYTLRFTYSCPSVTNQRCEGGQVVQNGLNEEHLTVTPGYGCSHYPSGQDLQNGVCGLFDTLTYTISSSPYGIKADRSVILDANTTISNAVDFTVNNCAPFVYRVNMSSCKEGKVTSFDVDFTNLPAGITLSGYNWVQNDGYVIAVDATKPMLYHITTTDLTKYLDYTKNSLILDFTMQTNCEFSHATMIIKITSLSSCGGILSSEEVTHHVSTTINSTAADHIDPALVSVESTVDLVSITYTITDFATTKDNKFVVQLPTGFKLKNSSPAETTTEIQIPINTATGTYTVNIDIEPNGPVCSSAEVKTYLYRGVELTCGSSGTCFKYAVDEVVPVSIIGVEPFVITLAPIGHCVLIGTTTLEVQVNGQTVPDVYNEENVLQPEPYTYQWYKVTTVNNVEVNTALDGATTKKYILTEGGIYRVEVSNGLCTNHAISQMMYVSPYPSLEATNGTSFLCDDHSEVDLEAVVLQGGTAPYLYKWYVYNSSGGLDLIQDQSPDFTYTTTIAGKYVVFVTDAQGCIMSTSREVADHVEIAPPEPVCPGQTPLLTITTPSQVSGSYVAGWFRENDDNLLTAIHEEGYYKAVTIAAGCTLSTRPPNEYFHITFKPQPVPFHLSPDNYIYSCNDVQHVVSITNKSVNDVPADGNYYNDHITYQWSNGASILDDQIITGWGELSIVSLHESGCAVRSNTVNVIGPHIGITRSCGPDGTIILTASTTFSPGTYSWYTVNPVTHVQTPVNPSIISSDGSSITVSTAGIYGVTNSASICAGTRFEVYENMVTTANNINMVSDKDGKFDNTTTCSDVTFESDLTSFGQAGCVDRSYYKTDGSDQLFSGTYASVLPGKYMINYGGYWANNWNPGFWQGLGYENSSTFMIVDGKATLEDQAIWRKTYNNIAIGNKYLFRAMVRNVSALNISSSPEEFPEVYLRVTYSGSSVGSYSYRLSRQTLYSITNSQWVELSAFTPAQPQFNSNYDISAQLNITVEIVLQGGNAIGRDFAIDNVSLIPVGPCDDLQIVLDNSGRNCGSVAQVDFYQKVLCPGGSAVFNVIDMATDPNVTYTWLQNGSPFQSGATLTVTPSSTSYYTLKVENLAKNCHFTQDVVAIVLDGIGEVTADNKEVCGSTGTAQLNASAAGATSYEWSPSTGLNNANIYNPTATGLTQTTDYTVTAKNISGCISSKQITVTFKPVPTVTVTPATTDLCVGTPLTLTASGADSYAWAAGVDLDASGATATLTLTSDPGNPITANDITVTGTTNGCSATATATVNRKETPVVIFTQPSICAGGNGDFNTQASGTYNYLWNSSMGLSSVTSANPIVAGSYPRSYNVTITDPANGCSVTQTVPVSVNFTCGDAAPAYDGVDDRTTIPYIATYNRGSGEFTAEAWVKPATTQGATYPTIMASRTAGGNGFLWSIEGGATNPGKRVLFQILGTNYYTNTLASSLYDNQCHHLAVSRTTAGVLTLYVDGVNQGQYTGVTGSINTTNTIMTIGAETNGTQPFRGSIGEVQFWSYAFTQQDITDYRYSLFTSSNINLIGYWKFKQTGTQIAVDESSVRNDGYYGNSVANTTYDPSFTGAYCGGPKILTVVPTTTTVCGGKTVTVNYTTAGFASGVSLQLFVSNASGSFTGTPSTITTNSTNSGSFVVTFPPTAGTNYLVSLRMSDNTTQATSVPITVVQCAGLSYDGNDVANASHHTSYNIGDGNFTLEAWVKFNSTGQLTNPVILSKRSGSSSSGFKWCVAPSTNGTVQANRMQLIVGTSTFNSNDFPSSFSLFDNQCHHLAVKREGTVITFYIDGSPLTLKPTVSGTLNMSNSANLRMGADYAGNSGFMKGNLNEVRVWNTARSDASILAGLSSSFTSSTTNLIGYWRFRELPGVQDIIDESANNISGTLGTNNTVEASDPTRSSTTCYSNERISADHDEEVHESTGPQITYYPNPFDKVLTVLVQDVATEETTATIQLMNVNGVEVYKGEIQLNSQNELHLDLPAGIYMAIVRYHNNSMYQHKVISIK